MSLPARAAAGLRESAPADAIAAQAAAQGAARGVTQDVAQGSAHGGASGAAQPGAEPAAGGPLPLPDIERRLLRRRLVWAWIAFWLLMFAVGVQEHLRRGGTQLSEPAIDYATAALVATGVALLQLRRARRLEGLLNRPLHWFARVWATLPLVAGGYVAVMFGLRAAVHASFGTPYRHEPWGEAVLYEAIKFVIFYGLFTAAHFGLRSYLAWTAERLRAEQQARLAQQAQLAQLTQQLHPHFLFNALNTVSALIHSDPDTADLLLTRLATLLRAATDASQRPEQPLADELQLLEAYAAIMTQRFADRAEVRWEIADAARACIVPTLGLQPLLENCFRHVVEQRRAPTRIVVRAALEAGRLTLEVEDDGDLRTVPQRRGVGLGNLERRLKALHGEAARLELQVRREGGLVVRVELPCAC